jgi:hypothetical protein
MSAGRRRTTPALIQRGLWLTVPDCKRVLFVVHTVTYGKRLRDVFSLLESDFRIQVLFTVAPHAFGQGVHQYLRNLGITVIPWKEAVRTEFDLAVAAGSQGTDEIRAPLIRMPHGAGHIKLRRAGDEASAGGSRVPGMLSREHPVRNGRVVPAALVLSHEQHLAALARSCPEALPVASVVGDPCYDRIVASVSRRDAYRRALGLDDERPLVLITSTWGRTSAFGRFDALLPRLVNELPKRFRTVVLVHPNVWAGHTGWQVRAWLGACRRRGVLLPPDTDFEALLIAADWIIGDHGSVTVYGCLTGVPILLARSPDGMVGWDSTTTLEMTLLFDLS